MSEKTAALKNALDKQKRPRGPASRTQRSRSPEGKPFKGPGPDAPRGQGDSPKPKPLQVQQGGAAQSERAPKDLGPVSKNARKSISSPNGASTLATKSLGEAIKNAKKCSSSPPTPGSPILKRGQRAARRGGGHVPDMNLTESQVNALEIAYQEKGSAKQLGKKTRKVLAEHTKLPESVIDQWLEAKNRLIIDEMDSADFIPEPVSTRRGRGVVASKVPSKEDVEVVDILDEEEEEPVELSLDERGGSNSKLKSKEDVKLTMVRNQQQIKALGVKAAFSQLPKVVPAKPSPAKPQPKSRAKDKGEVEEVMARVEELETVLREKDSELEAMKMEVSEKENLRAQLLDQEHTSSEYEKKLKGAEVKIAKMSEEHKKSLARKVEEELKRKLKEQADEKVKMEALEHENVKLKSKVEEIKLIKDDESKVLKAENKTLKADLKKTLFSKEEEVKTLRAEVKSLKTDDKRQFEKEKEKELKAKDEKHKTEIRAQEVKFTERLELKCLEGKQQLEKKDKEVEEKMAAKTEEFNLSMKQHEDQFKGKMVEAQLLILSKDEELVRLRSQSVEFEETKKMQKQTLSELESLKNQVVGAENKVAEGKKEVLDLKSYQRKLESKISEMEEEVMIAKAGVETQVKVRASLVGKVQEKEMELEDKEIELGKLSAERKVLEDKLATIEAKRKLEQAEMVEIESNFEAKIALLEIQLKEAEASTPSFPLSAAPSLTMYAANTPSSKRRHGSHRRLHPFPQDCEEELVQADDDKDKQAKTSIKPSLMAPCLRPLPFFGSSKRGRANDDENEEADAKRSHLDEDIMEEKEMSDLLNTSHEGEDNSDIAEEDITKLLDDEKDISSSMVLTVLDEVLEKVWEESDPSSPIFALSGKARPFVRNTPNSMRRHGSHRRLHDSGLEESDAEFEEEVGSNAIEEADVFISNQDQVKDLTARPVPFKQEREWTGSEKKSDHHTHSLEREPALATPSASSLSSKDDFVSHPVLKDSTCDYEKEAEEDLTFQDILKLLQR